jgi:hypothetical protein
VLSQQQIASLISASGVIKVSSFTWNFLAQKEMKFELGGTFREIFAMVGAVYVVHDSFTDVRLTSANSSADASDGLPLPEISESTDSDTSMAISAQWLEDCQKTHKVCNSSLKRGHQLPTRLIYVGSDWHNTHLYLSKDLPEDTAYMTLSHCWWKISIIRLLKKNLETFQRQLPYQSLTKTFRDAIGVARQFGVRYLWIDSLCIIQDDEEDWRVESALMSQVYGFSTMNVAATGAPDGNTGLFFNRDTTLVRPCRLEGGHSSVDGSPTFVYELRCWKFYRDSVLDTPLGQRAWVLQERFLAPRSLHFGSSQLIWECTERIACETSPDKIPSVHFSSDKTLEEFRQKAYSGTLNRYNLWSALIQLYTSCSLTQPKDKLIAISGIARWIHERHGGDYVCGLWREDVEEQLLWYAKYPVKRPEKYRAPSWSWASVDGEVYLSPNYTETKMNFAISMVDIQAELLDAGSDPYGQVTGGFLRLSCSQLILASSLQPSFEDGNIEIRADASSDSLDGLCYLMPMIAHDQDGFATVGLVLRAAGQMQGEFRRIGRFTVEDEGNDAFQQAQETPECCVEEIMYEAISYDDSGKKQYIIKIV